MAAAKRCNRPACTRRRLHNSYVTLASRSIVSTTISIALLRTTVICGLLFTSVTRLMARTRHCPTRWVAGDGYLDPQDAEKVLSKYPISDESKASFARLLGSEEDYLAGMSNEEKVELLRGISYSDFLRDHVGHDRRSGYDHQGHDQGLLGYGSGMQCLPSLPGAWSNPAHWVLRSKQRSIPCRRAKSPTYFIFRTAMQALRGPWSASWCPMQLPGSTMEDLANYQGRLLGCSTAKETRAHSTEFNRRRCAAYARIRAMST